MRTNRARVSVSWDLEHRYFQPFKGHGTTRHAGHLAGRIRSMSRNGRKITLWDPESLTVNTCVYPLCARILCLSHSLAVPPLVAVFLQLLFGIFPFATYSSRTHRVGAVLPCDLVIDVYESRHRHNGARCSSPSGRKHSLPAESENSEKMSRRSVSYNNHHIYLDRSTEGGAVPPYQAANRTHSSPTSCSSGNKPAISKPLPMIFIYRQDTNTKHTKHKLLSAIDG